jgi:hypothetical protein
MSRADRAYRLLLRAYPGATRDALGDDMAQLFADQVRDAGGSPLALAGVWIRALLDTVLSAPGEHRSARRRQLVEGPGVGDPRRPLRVDALLASIPMLLLWLLAVSQPSTGPMFDPEVSPPVAPMHVVLAALLVPPWLTVLLALRARTPVRKAVWALASVACLFAIILGPAVVLTAIRLLGRF